MPCAVVDMEDIDLLLLFHDAIYRPVDVRFVAVEKVSELVILGGNRASVRLFFQTENRLPEPAIPFERGVGVVGVDPPVYLGQIALGASGDIN